MLVFAAEGVERILEPLAVKAAGLWEELVVRLRVSRGLGSAGGEAHPAPVSAESGSPVAVNPSGFVPEEGGLGNGHCPQDVADRVGFTGSDCLRAAGSKIFRIDEDSLVGD